MITERQYQKLMKTFQESHDTTLAAFARQALSYETFRQRPVPVRKV